MSMKILFMGTPDFAVGALDQLKKAGHHIVAVVTQPDKPKGRSKVMQFPPVKVYAQEYDIPVLQPQRIKNAEEIEVLKEYEADVYIVAAFGQILSKEILEIPKYGCINIHASLLPKYRGAAPIQWAIIDGEEKTGVTIMQMNEGLDTGDMLYTKEVEITEEDTTESLQNTLKELGGKAIIEALALLEQGKLTPTRQEDSQSTYAKMIQKQMGKINWDLSAVEIQRLVRGLYPWPSAYTQCARKQLKVLQASVIENNDHKVLAGQVAEVTKEYFCVQTAKGLLKIEKVQLEGKKSMDSSAFLLGNKILVGQSMIE